MRKIPKVSCVFFYVIVFLFIPLNIYAVSSETPVNGTGDETVDVKALQKAVDGGGRVVLDGVFNFGTDGSINITKDVEIIGKVGPKGQPATRINGGLWTFHSAFPNRFPPEILGPNIIIRNIHFDGASWAPISISYCSGAYIRNIIISNVNTFDIHKTFFGRKGVHRQQGIIFYPPYTLPEKSVKYLPGLITGDIVIADNRIDLRNDIPDKTVAQGILITGTTGANIRVLRNHITNVCRNAVECIDNYPGSQGEGAVLIHDNSIVTPEKGITLPSPSTPNGIVAGWFMDLSGASDNSRKMRTIINGNRIETHGEASIGIIAIINKAVITSNHLILKGGKKARGILHFNSDALICQNRFEGSGLAGIMVTPWKHFSGDQNTFICNRFSKFKAVKANVVLRSRDNIAITESHSGISAAEGNLLVRWASNQ